MILEIAQIDVKPGMEAEFEAGVKKAAPIFKRAKGCKFMTLQRSHEMPQRYRRSCNGKRWKTIPRISGSLPISMSGVSWSATASRARPMSSMSSRSCAAFDLDRLIGGPAHSLMQIC